MDDTPQPTLTPKVGIDPELDELRNEFQALMQKAVVQLAGGMDGPMASRRLLQIQKVSSIGQDLLTALGGPAVRRGGRKMGGYLPIPLSDYDDENGLEPMTPMGGMMGGATAVETFGAKLLQEGIANLPELIMVAQAPNLIRSIKTARDAGLTEVADELQRKLHNGLGIDFATQIKGVVDPFDTDEDLEGEDEEAPLLTGAPLSKDDLDAIEEDREPPLLHPEMVVPEPRLQRPDLIVASDVPIAHEFSPETIRQHNLEAADG